MRAQPGDRIDGDAARPLTEITADPAARKPGRYAATLAFDAAGKLVMFGIMEYRGESDPAIAACLRKQEHPFSVPAPGRSLTYEVPFPLP